MTDDISQKAALEFFQAYQKNEHREIQKRLSSKKIIDSKNISLIPIRKLLKTLVDAGVHVSHSAIHDHATAIRPQAPQALAVWEGESSPHWQPGSSLYLDHPAVMEIAITNPHQQQDEGLVVISCSTEHPMSGMLTGPFMSIEEACLALAQFLSASTVRIDRPQDLQQIFGVEDY